MCTGNTYVNTDNPAICLHSYHATGFQNEVFFDILEWTLMRVLPKVIDDLIKFCLLKIR